ncbi:MAG: ketol-acid reductoisomerase [Halobacteriovoraceae bacterium]|nr:ketol-acid reductoisomerase [Halobacteriovoraceae bacterium]
MKLYYEKDQKKDALSNKRVAIFGFGNQGKAHALNLKDSNKNVRVALRNGSKSAELAKSLGLQVMNFEEAAKWANFIMLLLPDQVQGTVYQETIKPHLEIGDTLCFAHGLNIHFKEIVPPPFVNVIMVAPKSPGKLVRSTFVDGQGVPCLGAVYQKNDGAWDEVLSYANAIGGLRAGLFQTTFKDETETDLFGEQSVLCGGVSELVKCGFETLVESGYPKELAYFECLHELKLIVDLFYEGGLTKMNQAVSETAEYGGYTRGPKVLNKEKTKENMRAVLKDIQSGVFTEEYFNDAKKGQKELLKMRGKEKTHMVEGVGHILRSNMSWMKKGEVKNECRV